MPELDFRHGHEGSTNASLSPQFCWLRRGQAFNICDTWIVLVHHLMMYNNLIFRIYYVDMFLVTLLMPKNKQFFVSVTFVFKLPPLAHA